MKKEKKKKAKNTKQMSIKIKIGLSMILSLVITGTVLLASLVPRYTELVTDTTTSSMSDSAKNYQQQIESALNSTTSSIRNSKPVIEIADGAFNETTDSKETKDTSETTDAKQDTEESGDVPAGMAPPKLSGDSALSMVLSENDEYISAMSYSDLDGNILYSTDETLVNTSISSERYFQTILSGSSYAMGDAILTDEGTAFICAFSINNSDGEAAGIIAATFSSSYLANVLTTADAEPAYTETGLQLISGINILGVSGSTIYVCDANGIVITASDADWIGFDTTSENDPTDTSGVMKYESNKQTFYLAYSNIQQGNWTFCVDIPHADIFKTLKQATTVTAILSVILLILATIAAYIVSSSIAKPIQKTTESLEHLSNLELNKINLTDVSRKKDETGKMIDSIDSAVTQIKKVITLVENSSTDVYENAKKLSNISDKLKMNAQENSLIAEELSAGMEETASTQENIRQDITQIQEQSNAITDKINDGVESCEHIITNAEILNRETEEASNTTKKIYHDVKSDVDKALEKAKAVEKINIMTDSIMDIASQTSLLALNASIEAARAGDAGRGFAIVAEQIGSLANQSSETVSSISEIITEVNSAVTDMTSSLEKTLNFMESQVLKDYAKFIDVSNQYSDKSSLLREDMYEIETSINNFLTTLDTMSQSIQETADTMEMASDNTVSLTNKNTQVASIAADTNQMAQDSTTSAEQLNEILKVFKL